MVTMKINPDDSLVVLGDFQVGVTDLPLTISPDNIRLGAWGLARLAEIFELPTFAMSIPRRDGGTPQLIPEVTQTRTELRLFQRRTPDSFEDNAFREAVAQSGRTTLIVAGIATEICLQWITLSGIAHGYTVYVVTDASAGLGVRSEAAAFRRFERAGATLTSVPSLAGELAGDITEYPGTAALEVIYRFAGSDLPNRQADD